MREFLHGAYEGAIGVSIDVEIDEINDRAAAVRVARKAWSAGLYTVTSPQRFAAYIAEKWGQATDATEQQVENFRRQLAAALDPDGSFDGDAVDAAD